MNDQGEIRALSTYHTDLRTRLSANAVFAAPTNVQTIIGGVCQFARNSSPLSRLDVIIQNCERFMFQTVLGHGAVANEQISYVRRMATWLIEQKNRLMQHGSDVLVVQRYLLRVNEHIEGGQTLVQAAGEHPGFAEFERAVKGMQALIPGFEPGDAVPPTRSADSEADSDELVWLFDYYGELLEVRDLFRDAKMVFVHFAGWALLNIRLPRYLFTDGHDFDGLSDRNSDGS